MILKPRNSKPQRIRSLGFHGESAEFGKSTSPEVHVSALHLQETTAMLASRFILSRRRLIATVISSHRVAPSRCHAAHLMLWLQASPAYVRTTRPSTWRLTFSSLSVSLYYCHILIILIMSSFHHNRYYYYYHCHHYYHCHYHSSLATGQSGSQAVRQSGSQAVRQPSC